MIAPPRCPRCATVLWAGLTQCPNCGLSFSAPVPQPPPQPPPAPYYPPPYYPPPASPGLGGSITQGFGWGCGCLLVLVAMVVILVVLFSTGAHH
jgi:hypothetical protein